MKMSLSVLALLLAACTGTIVEGTTSTSEATTSSTTTTPTTPTSDSGESTTTIPKPAMLLVMGDWGSGTQPQGAVAGAMARFADSKDIQAIATTGDNFYADDSESLMVPYQWVGESGIDWWISWGNHDFESDRREEAVDQAFDGPPKWASHRWGRVRVLLLDSNHVSDDEQLEFLKDEMAADSDPTIVLFHHPAYSCSRHGDSRDVIEVWVPLFDDDVVLVMSGHDHNYQRIEMDRTYIVTGGGGRRLYDIEPCEHNLVTSAELHHFVVLIQDDNVIHGTALDVNGAPIDEFSVNLEPGVLDG